jgi:hypothetical protein
LKVFEFNDQFINLIKLIFQSLIVHITNRNQVSQAILINCRIRQGDSISLALYNIAIESFLATFKQYLEGIKLNKTSFKYRAFTDNITIGLARSRDLTKIAQILNHYEKASNTRLNKMKIKNIIFDLFDFQKMERIKEIFDIKWLNWEDKITILGYTIGIGDTNDKNN